MVLKCLKFFDNKMNACDKFHDFGFKALFRILVSATMIISKVCRKL